MFKMVVALDEERMKRDGLHVGEKWAEIVEMLIELPQMKQPERGLFLTESSGARSWLIELLEGTEWFMKYVSVGRLRMYI